MKKSKKLRCGYTTGSCAAAAAKAAAQMLLSSRICFHADLMTPKGIRLHLPVEEQQITEGYASCAVRKYGGDDPDATNGILIYAKAEYLRCDMESAVQQLYGNSLENQMSDDKGTGTGMFSRILIDGGIGVGRVTKPGLEQPVGAAAINRVPREMIRKEVESVCELYEYRGGLKITISVPEGVEIAKRTFNPHLGIKGGISILGTSGIVVPMSEEALIASIRVEMKQKVEQGEQYILITPGNYGADFIRRETAQQTAKGDSAEPAGSCSGPGEDHLTEDSSGYRHLNAEDSMKCSNYVGETLDIAEELGVKGILFVAHIGKFIKVSGGIMNTHSAHADCRAELMAAQAMRAGAPSEVVRQLLDTNTTEEAVGILSETGMLEPTMAEVTSRIQFHLQKHCRGALETEAVIFSNQYGYLGETDGADAMAEKIMEQEHMQSSAGRGLHTTI
ncbi:MAG: cobalt-precorrin-5B (C(1))-methyltransferase CbiD [Lachnospiraceae bacterium]|nr:cobalt-precorrin-5B (C(1))-methyltransferase CbiD [Lachnospiraceae bacterium]